MSRSRKKHAIGWLCGGSGMKSWKKQQNRRYRRIPIDEEMPKFNKFSEMWGSPADGKCDFTGWYDERNYRERMK